MQTKSVAEEADEAEFIAIPAPPPEPQGPPVDAITAALRRRIAGTRPPPSGTPLKMAGSACAGIGLALVILSI